MLISCDRSVIFRPTSSTKFSAEWKGKHIVQF